MKLAFALLNLLLLNSAFCVVESIQVKNPDFMREDQFIGLSRDKATLGVGIESESDRSDRLTLLPNVESLNTVSASYRGFGASLSFSSSNKEIKELDESKAKAYGLSYNFGQYEVNLKFQEVQGFYSNYSIVENKLHKNIHAHQHHLEIVHFFQSDFRNGSRGKNFRDHVRRSRKHGFYVNFSTFASMAYDYLKIENLYSLKNELAQDIGFNGGKKAFFDTTSVQSLSVSLGGVVLVGFGDFYIEPGLSVGLVQRYYKFSYDDGGDRDPFDIQPEWARSDLKANQVESGDSLGVKYRIFITLGANAGDVNLGIKSESRTLNHGVNGFQISQSVLDSSFFVKYMF